MDYIPDIPASYSPSVEPEFNVDRVQFGDGFEQRRPAGLNSTTESWEVSWNNLSEDKYWEIYNFLKSRKGVYAFLWQPPWEGAARPWVCTNLSSVRPTAPYCGSVTATLREDHNP